MTVAYPLDKSRDVDRRWAQRLVREANGLVRRVEAPHHVLNMWPVNQQRIGNVRNKDREVALPERCLAGSDDRRG